MSASSTCLEYGVWDGQPAPKSNVSFVVLRLRYVLECQVNFVYFIFVSVLCANASQLYSTY